MSAAHNQIHAVISACLKSSLSKDWHTFEAKSLAATGLRLENLEVRAEEVLLAQGETTAVVVGENTEEQVY